MVVYIPWLPAPTEDCGKEVSLGKSRLPATLLLWLRAQPATTAVLLKELQGKGTPQGTDMLEHLTAWSRDQMLPSGCTALGLRDQPILTSEEPTPEPVWSFVLVTTAGVRRNLRTQHHTEVGNPFFKQMDSTGLFKNNLCFLNAIIVVPIP